MKNLGFIELLEDLLHKEEILKKEMEAGGNQFMEICFQMKNKGYTEVILTGEYFQWQIKE